MDALHSVSKVGSRIVPASKGIVQNYVTGVGADAAMRTIDGLVGSPVQRIFSFNLPVIGAVGPIDVLNYIFHAGGFKFSRKGFIAVLSAKFTSGALKNIGPIALPGGSSVPQAGQATAATTITGGAT